MLIHHISDISLSEAEQLQLASQGCSLLGGRVQHSGILKQQERACGVSLVFYQPSKNQTCSPCCIKTCKCLTRQQSWRFLLARTDLRRYHFCRRLLEAHVSGWKLSHRTVTQLRLLHRDLMQGTFGPTTSSLAQGRCSQAVTGYGRAVSGSPLQQQKLSNGQLLSSASAGRRSG